MVRWRNARWAEGAFAFAAATLYFGWNLTAREISLLESQDLGIAHSFFDTYALSPDHSPLHFVFLCLWDHLLPSAVFWIRVPSVVFAAAAVPVVLALGRHLADAATGRIAALVFATNPLVVDAARSLRLYALGILLAALCLHSLAGRRRLGFVIAATLAIYNHLFAWLLVGPLALAIATPYLLRKDWRSLRAALPALVVLLPQVVHVFVAMSFTHERHSLHPGMPSELTQFIVPVVETLWFGEYERSVSTVWLVVPAAMVVLGVVELRRTRQAWLAALVLGPTLLASWLLSFSNPVEPRYLCFLTPALAVLMSIGLRRHYLAAVVVGVSLVVTQRAHARPPTDWYAAATKVASMRSPGEVVAVFPDFWAATFTRYGGPDDAYPVAFPSELDRALARRERMILVAYPGREFGNIDALLQARTRFTTLLKTTGPEPITVYEVTPIDATPNPVIRGPTLLFAGVVGSGGYSWQHEDNPRPFERLHELIAGSATTMVGVEPYHPSLPARLLLGGSAALLEPNPEVADALVEAGITRLIPGSVLHSLTDIVDLRGVDANREEALLDEAHAANVIAVVSSAKDYGRVATATERAHAHRLIDRGVAVVIGLDGYAAKEVEEYGHGVIAYSLGTLLRPPMLCLANQDSSGIGLRIGFPGGKLAYEVIPLTFDDQTRAALGRPGSIDRLVHWPDLTDGLELAHASAGGSQLEAWSEPSISYLDLVASLTAWFPRTVANTPLRPLAGGFIGNGAVAARRGVLSLGDYHRAVELDPGPNESVAVRFDDVALQDSLEVTYGLPDDRLRSKVQPLFAQRLTVTVGEKEVLARTVPYRVGWATAMVDTRAFAKTAQRVTIAVTSNGTHFPIAVDPRLTHVGSRRD